MVTATGRRSFSSWHHPHWKWFKAMSRDHGEEAFSSYYELVLLQAIKGLAANVGETEAFSPTTMFDRDSVQMVGLAMFLWHYRPMQHFFLDDGVADFCASSVKHFTLDYCKRLPLCPPTDAPRCTHLFPPLPKGTTGNLATPRVGGPAVPMGVDRSKVRGGFAIHFPTIEKKRSIVVIPDFDSFVPPYLLHYWCGCDDGEDCALLQPATGAEITGDGAWMARVVFGLSLYMDAFPDAVVPSSRDLVEHDHWYAGKHHVVRRIDVVDEEHRHSVSPHWRRGHFRLLASERFVRKQGQTVWVRGTFVVGKAFDVLADSPQMEVAP